MFHTFPDEGICVHAERWTTCLLVDCGITEKKSACPSPGIEQGVESRDSLDFKDIEELESM